MKREVMVFQGFEGKTRAVFPKRDYYVTPASLRRLNNVVWHMIIKSKMRMIPLATNDLGWTAKEL